MCASQLKSLDKVTPSSLKVVTLQFFTERNLVVSPEKSTVTLFTSQPNQARKHPQISINGTIVPLEKQPKILGVTHDAMEQLLHK